MMIKYRVTNVAKDFDVPGKRIVTILEEKLGKPYSGNILYHLDEAQLKHYTEDEINQILVY